MTTRCKCILKKKLTAPHHRKRTEKKYQPSIPKIQMMKDKIEKENQWTKKSQNYGSNDEIKSKLKFDKDTKNKNLKPKHWGSKYKIP